jgi:hypothetical protein
VVDYALGGTLRLADSPLGQGDGAYKVGPGPAVVRYADGRATLLSYSLHETFTVNASAFFTTMTIATASTTRATPDACGRVAEGVVKGSNVVWTSAVRGVHTEGTVTCTGKYCGSFGAPRPGPSPLKLDAADTRFRPYELSKDGKSFTMPFTLASKTESPKATSFIALTGREVKRTCVQPPKPCKP